MSASRAPAGAGASLPEDTFWPTRRQWACFLAAWAGWVLDAFDFTVYLLALSDIAKSFGASVTAASGVVTATLVCRVLGGLAAGSAADRWGRRPVLLASIVAMAACDGAIAFAPSLGWVFALRVLFGFAMGAEWTAGATLAMENWPRRSRGLASGLLQGSWGIGYMLAALVSRWALPHWGWRGLFLIAAAPAVLVLPLRAIVKEDAAAWRDRAVRPWSALLEPAHFARLAWVSGILTCGFIAYYALVSLYPLMLSRERGLDAAAAAGIVVWFNVGMLVGAPLNGLVFARWGARGALAVPALVTPALLPLYLGHAPAALPLGAFLMGAVAAGTSGCTPALLARLFPAALRGRASGLVYHLGALLASPTPAIVAALADRNLTDTVAAAMVAVTVAAEVALAALVLLLPDPLLRARAG